MAVIVEADGFSQLADGEPPTEHGQALEERGRLLAQDGEWPVARGDDEQGVGNGDQPQQAVDGLPGADHEAAQPPPFQRLEAGLDRPPERRDPDDTPVPTLLRRNQE